MGIRLSRLGTYICATVKKVFTYFQCYGCVLQSHWGYLLQPACQVQCMFVYSAYRSACCGCLVLLIGCWGRLYVYFPLLSDAFPLELGVVLADAAKTSTTCCILYCQRHAVLGDI